MVVDEFESIIYRRDVLSSMHFTASILASKLPKGYGALSAFNLFIAEETKHGADLQTAAKKWKNLAPPFVAVNAYTSFFFKDY